MTALTTEEVLATLRGLQAMDLPAHGGRTLAYVYDSGLADADAVGLEALAMFAASNGLDPTAFPSLARMENDLVAMAGALLDAPDGFAGSVTSGGTESILLAVLAARKGADHPSPSMVLPTSAHAAFLKAAPTSACGPCSSTSTPRRSAPTLAAMAAAVDDSTVLVVASAPSYAHGRGRPGAGDRGARRRARHPVPRRRLHRRLGAAAPGRRAAVDLRRRGRHERQRRPPQVRLHAQGVSVLLHRSAALRSTTSSRPRTGRATRCSTARCSRRGRAARSPPRGR